jgi:hypothetical protein
MEYATASRIMSIYKDLGAVISEADSVIRTLPEAERGTHLRALAGLVDYVWLNLQRPIVHQYKDLDPDAEQLKRDVDAKNFQDRKRP